MKYLLTALTLVLLPGTQILANEADVLDVKVECSKKNVCNFDVTVKHADEGWDHYADRWEIRDSEGKRIATRTLTHPHDDEQPFTRSLEKVDIPEGLRKVTIRARDSRHNYGGEEITVTIPKPK